MHTPECYKVGEADESGFQEYSFWVEIGGQRHLYQVRARSVDEAFAEVGRNVSHDFEQLREFGSPSAALLLVSALVGGVVLGAMAIRRVVGYLTGATNTTPSATPKSINANESLVSSSTQSEQPSQTSEPTTQQTTTTPLMSFASVEPYPWRPVTEFGTNGWRAGPDGDNSWRVIVFTDGEANLIRREFVREPEVNPETNVTTDGVVVYRFPLAALERVRVGGPGVVEVAISPTRPRGELGFLEVVAQTEEEALRFLIQYFDFIR